MDLTDHDKLDRNLGRFCFKFYRHLGDRQFTFKYSGADNRSADFRIVDCGGGMALSQPCHVKNIAPDPKGRIPRLNESYPIQTNQTAIVVMKHIIDESEYFIGIAQTILYN